MSELALAEFNAVSQTVGFQYQNDLTSLASLPESLDNPAVHHTYSRVERLNTAWRQLFH